MIDVSIGDIEEYNIDVTNLSWTFISHITT